MAAPTDDECVGHGVRPRARRATVSGAGTVSASRNTRTSALVARDAQVAGGARSTPAVVLARGAGSAAGSRPAGRRRTGRSVVDDDQLDDGPDRGEPRAAYMRPSDAGCSKYGMTTATDCTGRCQASGVDEVPTVARHPQRPPIDRVPLIAPSAISSYSSQWAAATDVELKAAGTGLRRHVVDGSARACRSTAERCRSSGSYSVTRSPWAASSAV